METSVNHPNLSKMTKELAELMHEHSKKDPNFNIQSSAESKHLVAYTILKLFLEEYDKLPRIITEAEYLKAIDVVRQYTKQVNEKSNEFLNNDILRKTPKELGRNAYFDLHLSLRTWNVLYHFLGDVKLYKITQNQFLKQRNAGIISWNEFDEFIQKSKDTPQI
jgi:hypothetical protein